MLVADIEELEQMDASELHVRRLNAKEVLTSMKNAKFVFPVADGTVKISGGDRRLRSSTLIGDRTSWRIRRTLFSITTISGLNTRWWFLVYLRRIHLSSSRWTQSQTVYVKRRIISYSNEVHRRHQNNIYVIGWTWMEKKNWQMHGARTGFTRFILLNERPLDRYTWFGRRLTRKQITSRPDSVWPDMWKHMSDGSKRKAKQSGLSRNQSLTMPDNWEEHSSLNLRMRTSRTSWKTLVESCKFRCQQQVPCKLPINSGRETHCGIGKSETNMLVLSKLTSPQEFDWKELLIGIMRIILQRKE